MVGNRAGITPDGAPIGDLMNEENQVPHDEVGDAPHGVSSLDQWQTQEPDVGVVGVHHDRHRQRHGTRRHQREPRTLAKRHVYICVCVYIVGVRVCQDV